MGYDFDQLAEAVLDGIDERVLKSELITKGLEAFQKCAQHADNVENNLDVTAAEEYTDEIWLEEIGRACGGNFALARSVLDRYHTQLAIYVEIYKDQPNGGEVILRIARELAHLEIKLGLMASCN